MELEAKTDEIVGYGGVAAEMASTLAKTGAAAAAADPAVLGPAFGLIGGDFVAAFTAAHATHVASINQLASLVESMGTIAVSNAANYVAVEAETIANIETTSVGIEA
ncbi:hypothetical protein [Antrihabitans stalactiti]|uniref:Excreted virulence factor EspC, type VII ESX diderm n=1 Tax=Antrihabitans stalactiti TaxID=2584121 RepID=A0A848KHE3_9NOCA|nr:hypothetical protein [Antrihabitans stalactiti]NMN96132.1 hypothetical protein [Antrihabitans stalactiti]